MSKQTNISRKLALESPERKPSVFERLGTKSSASDKNVCRSWAQNGTCSLNKTCKYAHTHVLISPSKRSKAEAMKKQSIVVQKRTGKEEHKKSSRSHQCTEAEWEGWELGDLEDADEKALERRKQELQRELQLQLKKEKELTRKKEKRSDKKRASSSSSSSTTSTASSSSTTSSSSSSSEPRKRQSRKRKHGSSSSDSDVSSHRPRKSPRTVKVKVTSSKKNIDKKDGKNSSESRNKSVVVAKKSSVQKKSTSPSWEKSRARTPHSKQQPSKKVSPHQSPGDSKNRSLSPRYDRTLAKGKARTSPKLKSKESSPKRAAKKVKESTAHAKDKMRQSPVKSRSSPGRVHKVSPSRARRHEDSEKRRSHYDVRKQSPRRERSREKERKREVRRGHSNENDNGGLKKGGKILPLKPSSYNKDNTIKPKDSTRRKSAEKTIDNKTKDVDFDKEKMRADRDKDRNDKEKGKSDREKSKHKKGSETHDRHSARDRESDRSALRGREDRNRDREAERLRLAKEREAERQKERDEALERCRERQRERERVEKERKEKDDKKHQRDAIESKQKDGEKELPSLLDLKTENPRGHNDSCTSSKNSDKHSQRDSRRNVDKGSEKPINQERDGRDRERLSLRSQGSPGDKDHDRREPRRSDDNERRQSDKDYDARRNRDSDARHVPDIRRPGAIGRRPLDDPDCRRPWDDIRRVMDGPHERRRLLEVGLDDRRPHPMLRRAVEDQYDYRRGRDDPDMDVRDFPPDDRRARKLLHGFHHNGQDWDPKAQDLEYREADLRDEWNHPDRHHDWPLRYKTLGPLSLKKYFTYDKYDHKWMDREESRDGLWNHYSRRPPHDDWKNDWVPDEPSRPLYREPNEDQLEMINEGFPDHGGRRHNEVDQQPHAEGNKEQQAPAQGDGSRWEKNQKAEGDALSDISDDPDDILNQEDETNEDGATAAPSTTAVTAAVTATTTSVTDTPATQNSSAVANETSANQNNNVSNSNNSNAQKSNQQIYVRNSDFFFDQSRPLLECFGERALDFEEISDEELEEEARAGKGIMDVLGADWAGLIKDVRPRSKRSEGPVVAHRRWMIDNLISRIGISVKYAGQGFTEELINKYKEVKQEVNDELKKAEKEEEEEEEEAARDGEGERKEVKEEVKENVEMEEEENCGEEMKREEKEKNISVNITVKLKREETEMSVDEKPEVGISLYHDVPALHCSVRECKNYRSSLFAAHNRFKRALSARTDLSLRRELCNLPSKEPLHFASPMDNKVFENSVKLFQRG